jgi:hypothetical protein
VIFITKDASVSITYQESEGVERAERTFLEFLTKAMIKEENVFAVVTTPAGAENALFIGSGTFTPYDSETDEVGVSDAFYG